LFYVLDSVRSGWLDTLVLDSTDDNLFLEYGLPKATPWVPQAWLLLSNLHA